MTSAGNIPPHPATTGRSIGERQDHGSGLNTGGRSMQHGHPRDGNARQEDRFARSLLKAMQTPPLAPTDQTDDVPMGAVAAHVPLPFLATPQAPSTAPADTARTGIDSIAERIDRYLRGAEGGQSLKQGEGMVVKLPANALGVTEVSLKLKGDVLFVSIAMQSETATANGMQSQLALLGQALSLRQPRHAIRVIRDGEETEPNAFRDGDAFNPLFPKGRIG